MLILVVGGFVPLGFSPTGQLISEFVELSGLHGFYVLARVSTLASFVAPLWLLAANSARIAWLASKRNEDAPDFIYHCDRLVAESERDVVLNLYAGAVVLACACTQAAVVQRLPASLATGSNAEALLNFSNSAGAAIGVMFSVVLAVAYTTSLWSIRYLVQRKDSDRKLSQSFRELLGATATPAQTGFRLLAVLVPSLVGGPLLQLMSYFLA